ncbi:UDP-3-O-acylglucosamine N-acyltransferase [Desulfosarcina ovata subsp. sediminis]|uniref:UDP-3-O-acylglucosamine N-acyltransferase n=1 Tax=Desulfosarcina ovata subsp. sediminis TaxID=885957 RepID=A0A5K7ZM17_9BACT|nr:UDP-3-O-(3-hydroxymyristoyl)glucosamine N-acyltransferase [Desulfosarcina ovata]BBO81385.1 UDP-3-O-acylglucosamine N-acyltransferase [Desulfosarcina ovata subsp. sediminis]
MADEYTLQQIAGTIACDLAGDSEKRITGIAPFDTAGPEQITFATGSKYLKRINSIKAGAVIVPKGFTATTGVNLIKADNPQLAFNRVVALFHPMVTPTPGISEQAMTASDTRLGEDVHVGAFVTVGKGAFVGDRSVIHNGVFIDRDVVIGEDVIIHPNVTIMHGCRIGNRVTIHPGTVIGSDGFGFVPDGGRYHKIPQMGIVQIDDDVEIGAGNTIDRATFGRTWIQRGVKTDNLVHIAHNVVIGEDSVIVAQVGIAGSTTIGHHAIIAGQAGISGHLTLGNHVTVGPMTGVAKPIADGEVVSSGSLSMPHRTWLRVQRIIPTLPEMKKQVAELEKKIKELEKRIKDQ